MPKNKGDSFLTHGVHINTGRLNDNVHITNKNLMWQNGRYNHLKHACGKLILIAEVIVKVMLF